jgi:hypothetical protein
METTNKKIIDTDNSQLRIIKTGSFTVTLPAFDSTNIHSGSVVLDDIFYSYKNIVNISYQEGAGDIYKMNWSGDSFALSDAGSDKLQITVSFLSGYIAVPQIKTIHYKIYSGTYA